MKLLLSFLVVAGALCAQTSVKRLPNCVQPFLLTADGSSLQLDNRGLGCNVWAMVYEKYGNTAAGSVEFEAAGSNANGGTAGLTFASFPSSPTLGSNPSTALFASVWFAGGAPFVRVTVTGLDGTLRGNIFGWVGDPGSAGGSGGGGVTSNVDIVSSITLPVDIVSPIPLPISGTIDITQPQACELQAGVSFSGTALAEIVPASGSLIPQICSIVLSSDTATTLTFARGTGANCGTGTVTLASFPAVLGIGIDAQSNRATFAGAASSAICISSSVSATIGGIVFYHY
jgi:hypothetical protein